MNLTTLALLVLTPFLVWRVYSRLKTMMARQRSIMSRHWTGLGVFLAMVLVPASELVSRPPMLGWLALGTAFGVAYGVWGLRLTRFEDTDEGYYFTPNARLGILVAMLFTARILYIGFEMYANQGSNAPTPRFTDSLVTMLAVGVTGGYFGTFSAGLLRWRLKLKKVANAKQP
ncbi:MAG: hypothetical protein JWR40_3363 [Massilia sp.]|jgi:hypothetical protein|nr:hypothetical protein [Massilia sp.]MDB5949872.1 hypothetical protein [Massilia sp.]